ncbi:MAG: type II toxin-antitoxin system RelE/ParE family toxin [Deltaproteobacteria bacterium]|nr:type II toxin-antitoxin system RelE/ParE family toxin [Deltaproteobacteria bacterium]
MIISFKCKKTEALYRNGKVDKKFFNFVQRVELRLRYLEAATDLNDLYAPPSNKFHALHGDRVGQYSISINAQWRICFTWSELGAENVEIVDYH